MIIHIHLLLTLKMVMKLDRTRIIMNYAKMQKLYIVQRIDTIIQHLLSNGDISWWLELQVNGTALCLADGLHFKGIGGVGPVRLQLEHCTSGHHRAYTQQLPHKE